jgi:starvation-inducible outer membrane lipoprotein
MKYLIPLFVFLFSGCVSGPTPQSEKETMAKAAIEENRDEANQARAEYIALQKKRKAEGTL